MSGLFEVLASADEPAETRAVIAAQTRAKAVFSRFLDQGDRESRLAFIDDDVKKMAAEVASEYGVEDADKLYLAATVALGGGHAADCTCGFCENKGSFGKSEDDEEAEEDMDKESSVKTACSCCGECKGADCDCSCDDCEGHKTSSVHTASVSPRPVQEFDWEKVAAGAEDRSGDSYQHERVELPTAGKDGLSDVGSPKIDKGKSGDETGWNLKPIDVDSQRHQLEHQDATDRAEYNDSDFDPGNPVRERVDADTAMQPEFTHGPETKTWSDAGTQASPVTAKWRLLA